MKYNIEILEHKQRVVLTVNRKLKEYQARNILKKVNRDVGKLVYSDDSTFMFVLNDAKFVKPVIIKKKTAVVKVKPKKPPEKPQPPSTPKTRRRTRRSPQKKQEESTKILD